VTSNDIAEGIMTTGNTDEQSVMDDVFSKSSDMGADLAAPVASPDILAPEVQALEPKPEEIISADKVDDDEAPLQGRDPKSGRFVPVTELIAERKKLKERNDETDRLRIQAEANAKAYKEQVEALQRQVSQPQRQAAPQTQQRIPDPYTEPEEFFAYQQQVIQQQLTDQRVNTSHMLANAKYGRDKVEAAVDAARQVGIAHRFIEAQEPFEALMSWHRKQARDAEVGEDLEAFKKRVSDEAVAKALANLKATGQPQGQAQPPQRFPGTLADQTPTGTQGAFLSEANAINDVFAKQQRRA
jgi:hypothetical protein